MRALLLALILILFAGGVQAQRAPAADLVMGEDGRPTRIVAPEGGYVAVFLVHPGGCPELLVPARNEQPTRVRPGQHYTLPAPRMAAAAGAATLTFVVSTAPLNFTRFAYDVRTGWNLRLQGGRFTGEVLPAIERMAGATALGSHYTILSTTYEAPASEGVTWRGLNGTEIPPRACRA